MGSKGPWGTEYSMINDTPVLEECTNFLLNGYLLVGVSVNTTLSVMLIERLTNVVSNLMNLLFCYKYCCMYNPGSTNCTRI